MSTSDHVHGLNYSAPFISSLPVLLQRPAPHQPIRVISAAQFAQIHLDYLTSHAPDNVIFPFLHGLEGENEAQNMFFAASGSIAGKDGPNVAKVPKFRGLVWVACDDEDSCYDSRSSFFRTSPSCPATSQTAFLHHTGDDDDQLISSSDDDYDSSSETTSDDLETFAPMPMDIDLDLNVDVNSGASNPGGNQEGIIHSRMELDTGLQGSGVVLDAKEFSKDSLHHEGAHMHPVNQRASSEREPRAHDRRPSQASTTSCTSTTSTTSSLMTPPVTVPSQLNQLPANPLNSPPVPFSPSPSPPPPPPLLTSSFRARELLREVKELRELPGQGLRDVGVEDGVVEFVEPRVPDGISLRNFGIQSLWVDRLGAWTSHDSNFQNWLGFGGCYRPGHDAIITSRGFMHLALRQSPPLSWDRRRRPRGNFRAAVALAEKFKQAIENKHARRVEKIREVLRRSGSPASSSSGSSSSDANPKEEEDLVKYNVFVLDASLEEMHDHLPHLVSRVEDIRIDHAYTDGTDAHVHRPRDGDADFEMEFEETASIPPSPSSSSGSSLSEGLDKLERGLSDTNSKPKPLRSNPKGVKAKPKKKRTILRANTINFAQREKDEMRDLTRASEILTYFPEGYRQMTESPDSTSSPSSLSSPSTDSASCSGPIVDEDIISGSSTTHYWDPSLGQVFLGNSSDVPLPPKDPLFARRQWRRGRTNPPFGPHQPEEEEDDAFDWRTNDPTIGFGYDICVECDDLAPFPSAIHMRAAEEHVRKLDRVWIEQFLNKAEKDPSIIQQHGGIVPPRPPPHANAVVHLPFPSSVSYSTSLLPFISWLENTLRPVEPMTFEAARDRLHPPRPTVPTSSPATSSARGVRRASTASGGFVPSSLPPPTSFPTSFLPQSSTSSSGYTRVRSTSATYLHNASSTPTSPIPSASCPGSRSQNQSRSPTPSHPIRTRPLKILIYSADGYTESSSLALCILMALRGLDLPEAYLELQVEKKRSFFVYQGEVGALKRIEGRLEKERERLGFGFGSITSTTSKRPVGQSVSYPLLNPNRVGPTNPSFFGSTNATTPHSSHSHSHSASASWSPADYQRYGHPGATKTMNEVHPASAHPLSSSIPNESSMGLAHSAPKIATPSPPMTPKRPRASTLPVLPSFRDHQVWFNDPRFDGSFPSRVLPFLYLGNLNHATNAYMLHALGITHVVSVGECALVPPPHHPNITPSCHNPHFVPGKGPGAHGSLWIEEREGRIKVLDIKGVCDDGIDTLEPQLAPICDWIDKARLEGGKVLVHCRVGVSRSATVTIAYVMKYLNLPLVDAYLIVRSRRLSVLIQPNMRLLYNLLGWEVKLAKERAGDDEERLKGELARCLNWPYLAKEVHLLNEKYLH